MKKNLLKRIEINPKIMVGKPVIRGTRITVELILEQLALGLSVDDVLSEYPRLTRDDVRAALEYAAKALSSDLVIPDGVRLKG
jgi:uncharacterized protein (DUF433 family)